MALVEARSRKKWIWAAAIFTVINVGGIPVAAASREGMHLVLHIVFALAGGFMLWRLTGAREIQGAVSMHEFERKLEELQHSVDVVAVEVGRVAEAQRHATKVVSQRTDNP